MDTQILSTKFGEVIEKGQQSFVSSAKTAASDISNTVSDQIGLKNEINNTANTQNKKQNVSEPSKQAFANLEETKEIVEDFYSPSTQPLTPAQAELEEQQRQAQLALVRQKLAKELHDENYFNRIRGEETYKSQILHAGESGFQVQNKQEQEQAEEQKNMEDLQMQQKKSKDLAKFRAERRVEIKGGIVG
jgi:Tfp pilus assembly protein PilW